MLQKQVSNLHEQIRIQHSISICLCQQKKHEKADRFSVIKPRKGQYKLKQANIKVAGRDIRGIIFDMDGLLLDTEALYLKAWLPVGEMMGVPITEAVARKTIGHDNEKTTVIFQEHYGKAFSMERAKPLLLEWIQDYVAKHGLRVKPGVRKLLKLLKQRGLPLAIGSSNQGQYVRAYLEEVGLLPYFDTIVTADLVERAKPAPDIFLQAAQNLGFSTEQCLVLEDSPIGVQAAHEAGCLTIVVPDLMEPCAVTRGRVWQVLSSLEKVPELLFGANATCG